MVWAVSVSEQKPSPGAPALDAGPDSHPTRTALQGFFAGMALMLAVPVTLAGITTQLETAASLRSLAPLGLLPLAVPLVLSVVPRTRRFGLYMLFGMVSTAVVVGGVAAAVLFVLIRSS